MSNLVLTKNGNIVRRIQPGLGNFPAWTSFIDDLFKVESGNIQNADFNKGITLPKVNIKESVDAYTLEMAVPGFKKSDFVIDVENENLTISADIKTQEEETQEDYTRKEFAGLCYYHLLQQWFRHHYRLCLMC